MLTVYSTHGSPGASATAIYLAAQWASTGRQTLLIETDPAAGSLSQRLGVQFTPGTASFVASDKPVTSANLIDHAQDVLFNDLHVMPTPSSPSGARTVAEKFARQGEELRDVSESEMAVIVDGGRLTAEVSTSELTTSAAAVLVVTRDANQLNSLEHLNGVLVEDPAQPGPLGFVATVGPSSLKESEWLSQHGLIFVGSVDLSSENGTDLSIFVARGKRKSRKIRGSLEKLADALVEYAFPGGASSPRVRVPAARPEVVESEASPEEAPLTVEPDEPVAEPPGVAAPDQNAAPATQEHEYEQVPQAPGGYAGQGYEQPGQHRQDQYPPSGYEQPGQHQQDQYPPGQYPPGQHQQDQYPPGQYPPGQYPPGGYEQPGQHQQDQYPSGQYPPGQYPPGQYPPGGYEQPGQHQQDQYPPGQYPPGQYPPGQYPPGQYPPGGYEQSGQHQQDQYPSGQYPPGQYPPGQYPPGQYPPGQYPPGQYPPGQYPPGGYEQSGQYPPAYPTSEHGDDAYRQTPYPQHEQFDPAFGRSGYPEGAPSHAYPPSGGAAYSPPPVAEPLPASRHAEPQHTESVFEAPEVPTGSFRSWAAHLHGKSAGSDADDDWPRPDEGVTA
ncbi:hypothetical protein [Candidatus Poriferisodalis sp.]|uniref:hypothetical protein n=1 Tax=Candidatus Poriferisodalis sp. TaxID=3101277 RepID=UPI003B521CC8